MNAVANISGRDDRAAPDIKVSVGLPGDVHHVMDVALLATDENAFAKASVEKLLENIWAALNLKDGICGVIRGDKTPIEGVVLLRIGPPWYSDDKILEEKSIFVHPDYRSAKGGRARKLAEFSKMMSEELGIPLAIGVLSNERTAAKVRMYTRIFGQPSGAYWLYGTKTGNHGRDE